MDNTTPEKQGVQQEKFKEEPKTMAFTALKRKKKVSAWKISTVVLIILLAVSIFTGGFKFGSVTGFAVSSSSVKDDTLNFINENLLAPGTEAEIVEIVKESGVYKATMKIADQEFDSFISSDGKYLFTNAVNMKEFGAPPTGDAVAPTEPEPQDIPKQEKPVVELFVMSHCPYGTQIEKGLIPVIETLGNKADIQIKFCDYAMHGEKELNEELNQVCIQEEFSSKYIDYLNCFLEAGESEACIEELGINKDKLNTCTEAKDKEFKITEDFEDESTWLSGTYPTFTIFQKEVDEYGVQGSPTLIINGVVSRSSRDSASLLAAVCQGFKEEPEECSEELSTTVPSPGFGFGSAGDSSSQGTC